ncbi:MAG: chromate efflux transporter [Polyangiales bacterium]
MPPDARTSLWELAALFFRLGATSFGGLAAHVAMMEDERVRRRKWLTEERFLDLVGATNLIPGPNSTELAMHVGWERRRGAGLVVAGGAFILPAALITGALGHAYARYGAVPSARWLLHGVKPVVLAVVLQALWGLAPKAARTGPLRALGLVAMALTVLGAHELAVLFGCGLAAALAARVRGGGEGEMHQLAPLAPVIAGGTAGAAASAVTVPGVFGVFLKTGSVLFGSGYVLLAFLRADLVARLRWMTEAQLLDAVAVGQVTPGPVFTTATFIGYVLAGPAGAVAATVGIFLPAFVFVALSGPLVPRLRASARAGAFLDGVNVASLALMALVTLQLGRAAVVDAPTVVLALASAALLVRWKVNSAWLVLGGAAAGGALHAAGIAGG